MEGAAGRGLNALFSKRECHHFVPQTEQPARCQCGEILAGHRLRDLRSGHSRESWNPASNTRLIPTDAYGKVEFQDGVHSAKAQYIRLAFDTRTDHIMFLLTRQWGLELPKLLITVYGGATDFDLPTHVETVCKKGFLKAAKTTGAWILTGGVDRGATKHVGAALASERSPRLRPGRVVSIGIAPWGMVGNRNVLIAKDRDVPYSSIAKLRPRNAYLNSHHSNFLLADNGTVGQSGHEMVLRRRLEKMIATKRVQSRIHCIIPTVCLILGGDQETIETVVQYVTDYPPVPVVVIEGSGRAADLLTFACRNLHPVNPPSEKVRDEVIMTVMNTFGVDEKVAFLTLNQLLLCAENKNMITIFNARSTSTDSNNDLDYAILTTVFKSRHLSAQKKLSLALLWNRADLARKEVFVYGQVWPDGALDEAMMEALIYNRVEFVKLLLEKGVSITRFLTVPRLEELYNSRGGPANTLHYLVADIRPSILRNSRFTLMDIGMVINMLMGGAYTSFLSSRKFRQLYSLVMKRKDQVTDPAYGIMRNSVTTLLQTLQTDSGKMDMFNFQPAIFNFPFNELLIWAILTKRHAIALLMWQHGPEALAKALAACCLYKAIAKEAAEDDLEVEICEELKKYASDFEIIALELVDFCYRRDDDLTFQLLTCALPNWGRKTCLHLAVVANLKDILSHPSAQILLADLWMGGLRTRKSPNVKVFVSLLCPPLILKLDFKSREELLLMPQTEEEYLDEIAEKDTDETPFENSWKDPSTRMEAGHDNPTFRVEEVVKAATMIIPHAEASAALNANPDTGVVLTAAEHTTGVKHRKQLTVTKKLYEFYGAPITKFWTHSVAYFVFLCLYTYTVLIRSRPDSEWNEYYVLIYCITLGLEKVREIAAVDGVGTRNKMKVWASSGWNGCDTVAIFTFVIAFILRCQEEILAEARVIYSVNIIYWYVRILRFLQVSKFLGPLVTLIFRYTYTMAYFVTLLCPFLLGYGVFRQSLLYPNNEPNWASLRNVTFQPYFMIYGELFAEEIDAPCGEPGLDECAPGRWLNPIFMTGYLLMSIVLLLNMLIAVFNSIFIRKQPIARKMWKFQWYSVVMYYEETPILPPPFILISHVLILIKWWRRCAKGKPGIFNGSLKLFLDDKRLERVRDFEEECMEDLAREQEMKKRNSSGERARELLERVESLQQRIDNVSLERDCISEGLNKVESLLKRIFCSKDDSESKDDLLDPETRHALNSLNQAIDYIPYHKSTSESTFIAEEEEIEAVNPVVLKQRKSGVWIAPAENLDRML